MKHMYLDANMFDVHLHILEKIGKSKGFFFLPEMHYDACVSHCETVQESVVTKHRLS